MSKNSRDISMNLRAYSSRVPDPWCTLPWHPALFPEIPNEGLPRCEFSFP